MSTVLDWGQFQTGSVGPDRAFEAFTAQIFERWIKNQYNSLHFTSYVLQGEGGDGGVEAFADISGFGVVGLQAKWFPENINASRIAQIKNSIATATKTFENLRQYVIAMPRNLTKGTPGKRGKKRKGGVERWTDLITETKISHPNLDIIRWDEDALLEQLAAPGNHELRTFWFSGEFPVKIIETAWLKARSRLRHRYIPELHAIGAIDSLLESDSWSIFMQRRISTDLARSHELIREASSSLEGFSLLIQDRGPTELRAALDESSSTLTSLRDHATLLAQVLSSGPRRSIAECPSAKPFWMLSKLLEDFKESDQGRYSVTHAERAVTSAQNAYDILHKTRNALLHSATPRLICGPAGCGKTHAAATAVELLVAQSSPSILVLAEPHDPSHGIRHILEQVLDLPNWPLARMLDGLEALEVLNRVQQLRTSGERSQGFSRCLLLIDGLEESQNSKNWPDALGDLALELASRPRIHLVATARPEYLATNRVKLSTNMNCTEIRESKDSNIPRIFEKYTTHFRISTEHVPWLGWALKTPLEVRLFAEEFEGKTVSASDGACVNLLTLFRRKLTRLEDEARRRAGSGNFSWSPHLTLVSYTLEILADLTVKMSRIGVHDAEIIRNMESIDHEFTAQRVRFALDLLCEHGLVGRWSQSAKVFSRSSPTYSLSTRHISDFILALSFARQIQDTIKSHSSIQFPPLLMDRPDAAILFAAQLAENRLFVTDVAWSGSTPDLRLLLASSLTLIPHDEAANKRDDIIGWLLESTRINRAFIRRLILPVSRIPEHKLGPQLLDHALRSLPLASRDPIWSVPEDLDGTGPWRMCFDTILDNFELSADVDHWDGRPLLAAWTCSSVVEQRRQQAREMIAVWGSKKLSEMAKLLEHMASVDDPQIVDDIAIAAFGAVLGAAINDPALRELAYTIDRLFFAHDAPTWTESVVVRVAARGIVERASIAFPGEFEAELKRSRPPYKAKGPGWPPIDPTESQGKDSVVILDLDRYIADRCMRCFADGAIVRAPFSQDQVDSGLLAAINEGKIAGPASLQITAPVESEPWPLGDDFLEELASEINIDLEGNASEETDESKTARPKLNIATVTEDEEREKEADEKIRLEIRKLLVSHQLRSQRSAYSKELKELLDYASKLLGIPDVPVRTVRNGMVAYLVKGWGWTHQDFSHKDWNNPASVVDDAIERTHNVGYQTSRSAVASFREKYVWAAVDRLAGALADRLPVWSSDTATWALLDNLDDIGNPLPDPLPASSNTKDPQPTSIGFWAQPGILEDLFIEETSLAYRAERWITEGPQLDPRRFISGAIEHWSDAVVLGCDYTCCGHQACIDQLIQVRAYGVQKSDLPLIRRDAQYSTTIRGLYDGEAGSVGRSTYLSPAIACWAPWITWGGLDQGYLSFDNDGNPRRISIKAMIGSVIVHFGGELASEDEAWLPSPRLRDRLGIVGMRGDRWRRSYVDRNDEPVAVERDVYFEVGGMDQHHYIAGKKAAYYEALVAEDLIPVWVVRVYREVTPAIFMHGYDIKPPAISIHRSRSMISLVIGVPDETGHFEVVPVADELELF